MHTYYTKGNLPYTEGNLPSTDIIAPNSDTTFRLIFPTENMKLTEENFPTETTDSQSTIGKKIKLIS